VAGFHQSQWRFEATQPNSAAKFTVQAGANPAAA
jgi:hypothetical protein